MNKINCKTCGAPIDIFDTFPGNLCLRCHARKVDNTPLPSAKDMADAWKNPNIINLSNTI